MKIKWLLLLPFIFLLSSPAISYAGAPTVITGVFTQTGAPVPEVTITWARNSDTGCGCGPSGYDGSIGPNCRFATTDGGGTATFPNQDGFGCLESGHTLFVGGPFPAPQCSGGYGGGEYGGGEYGGGEGGGGFILNLIRWAYNWLPQPAKVAQAANYTILGYSPSSIHFGIPHNGDPRFPERLYPGSFTANVQPTDTTSPSVNINRPNAVGCYTTPDTWTANQPTVTASDPDDNIVSLTVGLYDVSGNLQGSWTQNPNSQSTTFSVPTPAPTLQGDNFYLCASASDSHGNTSTPYCTLPKFSLNNCSRPFIQTNQGDVHSNTQINTPSQ